MNTHDTPNAPSNDALAERIAAVEQRLDDHAIRIDERFRATDRALDKQDKQDEYNRAQQNEWRGSLQDLGEKMATKDDVRALEARIAKSELQLTSLPNRADLDRRFDDMTTIGAGRDKRLAELERGGAAIRGGVKQRDTSRQTSLAVWGMVMLIIAAIVGGMMGMIVHNAMK